jgi:MoaA/NifB/PqqE/SkfB family radical SAM enzyme
MRFNNFWCYRRILFSKNFAATVLNSRRNVIAYEQGRPPVAGPYMAELDITYRCNCRCEMCQRWQDSRRDELSLEEYRRLAEDFHNLGVHQISVAGGEPLLRPDVFSIIESYAKLGMSVNLCTNGLLLQKYHDEICNSGATCVSVSLDGATAESHDAIRGIPGSYRQIEKGIETLLTKHSSAETRPILRVRMTISNRNAYQIRAFYRKWKQKADDVLLQPVHHCHDSYYTGLDSGTLNLDPRVVAEQIAGTPLEDDGYMKQLVTSLEKNGSFPNQRCYAGVLMTRIDPWGNVYPCLEQHVSVGSLREKTFESIWESHRFNLERQRLASKRQCTCWYNNTAFIGHYGKLLKRTHSQALLSVMRNLVFSNSQACVSEKK